MSVAFFKKISPEAKAKIVSVAKGALIAAGGALVTYGAELVAGGSLTAFGPFAPIVGVAASVAINAARKFLEKAKAEPVIQFYPRALTPREVTELRAGQSWSFGPRIDADHK